MSRPPPRDRVVVDTDVVSFLFKRDSRAALYRPNLTDRLLVISFMTVAELDRWVLARNWGERRRTALEQHLRNFVVYPFDRALCRVWAEVTVGVSRGPPDRLGRRLGCRDGPPARHSTDHPQRQGLPGR